MQERLVNTDLRGMSHLGAVTSAIKESNLAGSDDCSQHSKAQQATSFV